MDAQYNCRVFTLTVICLFPFLFNTDCKNINQQKMFKTLCVFIMCPLVQAQQSLHHGTAQSGVHPAEQQPMTSVNCWSELPRFLWDLPPPPHRDPPPAPSYTQEPGHLPPLGSSLRKIEEHTITYIIKVLSSQTSLPVVGDHEVHDKCMV